MDKKFKIFVIIALLLLTVVTCAAVALVFVTRPGTSKDGEAVSVVKSENLQVIKMDEPLNANLKIGEDKIPHIIRLDVALQIDIKHKDYKNFIKDFAEQQAIVRDGLIDIVRSKTYEQMNEELAKETLAQEIMMRINERLGTDIVQNIYFGDYFIQ